MCQVKARKPTILMEDCREFPKPFYAIVKNVTQLPDKFFLTLHSLILLPFHSTRVGTLIVATIYLQLIQNRYMFRSFTVLQCSHQHCVQPVASGVEVVGYL